MEMGMTEAIIGMGVLVLGYLLFSLAIRNLSDRWEESRGSKK
jgi:hypothetical protein